MPVEMPVDEALMALVRRIAAGDDVTAALQAQPELATASLRLQGATRQQAEEYFLTAISHHVYRGDTALHVAAATYRVPLVRDLVASGAAVDATNRRGA